MSILCYLNWQHYNPVHWAAALWTIIWKAEAVLVLSVAEAEDGRLADVMLVGSKSQLEDPEFGPRMRS